MPVDMQAVNSVVPLELYPVIVAAILAEIAWYRFTRHEPYPWREFLVSLAIFIMRLPTRLLQAAVMAPLFALAWSCRVVTVPIDTWWGLALLFLGVEFCYYWVHRCDHRVRWLWATHAVHHSPERIHLASAFRLGLTGAISGSWLLYLPLVLLGFHPVAVAGMLAANLFFQFWLHTDAIGRLGPLEWIFNTPSHHRVHHASNTPYLDRNFGGVIIIWDRLFGTFAAERPGLQLRYGLVEPIGSSNPLVIALHEWRAMFRDLRKARGPRAALRTLFGPPEKTTSPAASAFRETAPSSARSGAVR